MSDAREESWEGIDKEEVGLGVDNLISFCIIRLGFWEIEIFLWSIKYVMLCMARVFATLGFYGSVEDWSKRLHIDT